MDYDLSLISEKLSGIEMYVSKIEKENETMREQLRHCEQRNLLNIIEELNAKISRLECELKNDPTKIYLTHIRNERIVKLLSEAFKYINDPMKID